MAISSYVPFVWDADCQRAFDGLKQAFVRARILAHFGSDKQCVVEITRVLSQYDDLFARLTWEPLVPLVSGHVLADTSGRQAIHLLH
jgi:hypothetical protein